MGILYQDDLDPKIQMPKESAYEIRIKRVDGGNVTTLHISHENFKKIFIDAGYTPKWQQWDNDSRKYVSAS